MIIRQIRAIRVQGFLIVSFAIFTTPSIVNPNFLQSEMLDRLVRRAVFADADAVMGENVNRAAASSLNVNDVWLKDTKTALESQVEIHSNNRDQNKNPHSISKWKWGRVVLNLGYDLFNPGRG